MSTLTANGRSTAQIRRLAARHDLGLIKSRRRDPNALDYGQYWLFDTQHNWLVFPSGPGAECGADLDDVEAWLVNIVD